MVASAVFHAWSETNMPCNELCHDLTKCIALLWAGDEGWRVVILSMCVTENRRVGVEAVEA